MGLSGIPRSRMCDDAVVLASGFRTNPIGRLVDLSPFLPGRSSLPGGFEAGDIIVGNHVPAIQKNPARAAQCTGRGVCELVRV